jgi:23S rRNA-/tRNA-specific pseudouridylate synthase
MDLDTSNLILTPSKCLLNNDGLEKLFNKFIMKNSPCHLILELRIYLIKNQEKYISEGRILVNHEKTFIEKILKDNELLTLQDDERIEFPIINFDSIEVLFENEDLFVINKPPSLPTHPSGSYYKNSLVKILRDEFGLQELKVIHRLDKVTTGVLIFAKSLKRAFEAQKLFKDQHVKKMYISKVFDFPFLIMRLLENF